MQTKDSSLLKAPYLNDVSEPRNNMYLSCHNIYLTFTRLEGSLPSLDVVAFSAYVTYTSHKYSAGDCPELITRWSLYLKKFAVPIYFQFGFLNPFVTGINLKA